MNEKPKKQQKQGGRKMLKLHLIIMAVMTVCLVVMGIEFNNFTVELQNFASNLYTFKQGLKMQELRWKLFFSFGYYLYFIGREIRPEMFFQGKINYFNEGVKNEKGSR